MANKMKTSFGRMETTNNLVAKHARQFNKSSVMIDRKRQEKLGGKRKHKNEY